MGDSQNLLWRKTMNSVFVNVVRPVLIAFLESEAVKNLVVDLLDRYAKSTSNDIDDVVVGLVRSKLLNR